MPEVSMRAPASVAGRSDMVDGLLFDENGTLLSADDAPSSARDAARRRALAAADMLALMLAYAVVWVLAPPPVDLVDRLPLLAVLPMWLVINVVLGLYDRDANVMHKSSLDELPRLVHSLTLGTLLIFLAGEPLLGIPARPLQTATFIAAALILVPGLRAAARGIVRRAYAPERVAIIGSGPVAAMVARKLETHREYGVEVVGVLDGPRANQSSPDVPTLLGDPREIERVARRHGIERVVIAFGQVPHHELVELIRRCKLLRLKITVVPRLYEVIGHRVDLDEVEGMLMLGMRSIGRSRTSLALKRAIDIMGAAVGLVVLMPMLVAIAVAIRLTSRGPAIYSQERMGKGDVRFRIYKFRTMVADADGMKPSLAHLNETGGVLFKMAADPRVTRVGRFLRRTSLDELPQLYNVLRGEMSLVGPRPLVPDEDDHCIGWHRTRLQLTPGLTGPWQVAGRTAVPFHEMVKIDYLYVAEWTLWNDIRLLLRTLPVVVFARGS